MSTENKHTDDFKKLFDNTQMPELPLQMEGKIMASIEIQKLRTKRSAPQWFTTNLIVFSISIFLSVLISVFQFTTDLDFALLNDLRLMLLFSTGIFGFLWFVQLAESLLIRKLSAKSV